ncbi:MAG: hypothetical protein EOP50_04755 [Sphingobacteriales bacterium]|nr:MAG: hypothetical protein EOP50_04755 [Sphingobacteriales bacterium]
MNKNRHRTMLMKQWLPTPQFMERHATIVAGPAEVVIEALASFDTSNDPLILRLLQLREAPSRLLGRLGGRSALTGRPCFGLQDFILLERRSDFLAFGLAGKFWELDFGLHPIATPEEFRTLAKPGVAKFVMTYALSSRSDGRLDLVTETQVQCPDARSMLPFTLYWYLIRLGSGLIRRRILSAVSVRSTLAP